MEIDLICPKCRGKLEASPDRYSCSLCGIRYPVVDGIPQMLDGGGVTSGDVDTSKFFGDLFSEYGKWLENLEADTLKNGLRTMFRANGIDLAKILSGRKRILEAGCGYGRYTYELLKEGAGDITCLDLSQSNLRNNGMMTAAKFPGRPPFYARGSVTSLPFPDRSFDLVVCTGVIHHIDEYWKGLDELIRVTAPGGGMIFAVIGAKGVLLKVFRLWRLLNKCVPLKLAKSILDRTGLSDQSKRFIFDAGWASHYHQKSFKELQKFFLRKGASEVTFLEIYRNMYGYPPFETWLRGEGFMHMYISF